MTIKRFFTKTIIVRRPKRTGDKSNLSATATVDGNIQDADEELFNSPADVRLRTFKIYTEVDDDVASNDQIEDKDTGVKYIVKNVNKKDYGALQHLEILAERLSE